MTNKILCNTDFFIALLIQEDSNHEKALAITHSHSDHIFTYSNLTKYELVTVLSRKLPQKIAIQALEIFEQTFDDKFNFDVTLEDKVLDLYKKSLNKNVSFFDVACLVQAQKYHWKIASFDRFYPSEILISVQ
jgi:predicted nucleic acid-binding protein